MCIKFEIKETCCTFCDLNNAWKYHWYGVEEISCAVKDEGFYLDDKGYLRATADDPYCGTSPLKINFCPMCGRKLEHKEDVE